MILCVVSKELSANGFPCGLSKLSKTKILSLEDVGFTLEIEEKVISPCHLFCMHIVKDVDNKGNLLSSNLDPIQQPYMERKFVATILLQ